MELFQAKDHYILQSGEKALWCSRKDGTMEVRPATDLLLAWNPVCLGLVEGVIGKIQLHADLPLGLIMIRQKALVGKLPGDHSVYKITKITVIPLSEDEPQDLELELCKKHHFGINKPEKISQSPDESKFLLKTFSQIKSNVAVPIKKKVKENKEKERLEKRLLDELLKIFMDSDSFYYSVTYDLTNTVQRQGDAQNTNLPLWQRVDDRFFWNKYMIQDLINLQVPEVDFWVIPVIQGFVQIEELVVNYNEGSDEEKSSPETPLQELTCVDDIHPRFTVALISRRSRHRAGMRYKRRGVDQDGHVANFVETEQQIHVHSHTLSFVQTRGSVPVFWSQAGYRYNPRPRLEMGEKETATYFATHFEEQLKIYKKQVIINLIDQTGREKIIGDAFLKQVLLYNNPNLTYVSFDFHEHCRGMKFENVQTLTDAISDIITDMRWCWVDQAGVICRQDGIFRVNCMDCLDRTNVVQAAIARTVMEQQLKKLGVMPPEQPLPLRCYRIYQVMWANNGDTISRQYAGTAALKGDFTRTGERKLAGVMKDGVNSANRYYLNRFRDAYRQAVIDLMMGLPVTEDLYSIFSKEKEQEEKEKEQEEKEQAGQRAQQEQVSLLLQTYMQLLLLDEEKFHGGWALIDCDPSLIDATHKDVDVLLLLSNSAYYVAYYDDEADKVSQYQRIGLEDLEKIEIGPEPTLFGKPKFCCMRVHHKKEEMSGYFHTLRAVTRHPEDDGKDTLQCIAEILRISKQALGLELVVTEKKLERKHSRPHDDIMGIREKNQDQVLGSTGLAQGKNFLMNKFSSLNQKVKQTKSNVNIGNFKPLGKLGNISKTDVTVNFLKPNMKVALWKSDSSLETLENNPGGGAHKGHSDASDLEISSDSDSCHSDDRPHSASLENVDYVLPSCGIVASAPRLGARSQSIGGGVEIVVPSVIRITNCEGKTEGQDEAEEEEGRDRGPKGQGEAPKGRGKSPDGRGKSPEGRGKSPEGRDRGPKGQGEAPEGRNKGPKGQGEVPKGQNKAPEGRGKSPEGRGKAPEGRDKGPKGQGEAPEGRVKGSKGQGEAPKGQGEVPKGQNKAPEGPGKSPEGRGKAPEGRDKGPKGQGEALTGRDKAPMGQAAEAAVEEDAKLSFGTPIDAYCLQFAQDAKSKCAGAPEAPAPAAPPQQDARAPGSAVAPASAESQPPLPPPGEQQLPRPAQLDVSADLLSVQPAGSAASASSQRSLGAPPEGSAEPSPADGSRTVSPFAKIRSSMVQVASLTQAGLSQGISFAVAKVQKSPEPEAVNETQQNQLKAMFTQCQTRIIQI